MFSQLHNRLCRVRTRLTWSGIAVMMLLQRTPVLRVVADFQFSMSPRLAHMVKWVTGAVVTSAFYNTVTGATGDLSTQGNTTVVEGTNTQVVVTADRAVPVTAQLVGDIPPGLVHNIGEGGVLESELLGFPLVPGTIAFSGVPTTAGNYPVTVTVLTWQKIEEPADQPERSILVAFEITLQPPEITRAPESIKVPLGATAELSVEVADPVETTYQWQRNVGEGFGDIDGATSSVYAVPNATSELQGAYRVRVTKNGITITSGENGEPLAYLTVDETPDFRAWQWHVFEAPNSEDAEPLSNPDGDSFINAFEFLFDLDPLNPESGQSPEISREQIGQTDYVVFTFPALIDYPGLVYAFESTPDLKNGPWTQLSHNVEGVIVEATENGTIIKLPIAAEVYLRLKVDTD